MNAIRWQKVEGFLVAAVALTLVVFLPGSVSWWVWPVFLLVPDLSMLGYLAGPRVGARVYNAAHLYAVGLAISTIGVAIESSQIIAIGAIWTAHVGLDRWLGYGLKLPTGFQDTHLGRIGRR